MELRKIGFCEADNSMLSRCRWPLCTQAQVDREEFLLACLLQDGWMELYGVVKRTSCFRGFWFASQKSAFAFRLFFPSTSLFYPLRTIFPVRGLASSFSSDHICIYYESSFPFLFPELLLSLAVIVCSGVIDVCGGVFFWLDSIT